MKAPGLFSAALNSLPLLTALKDWSIIQGKNFTLRTYCYGGLYQYSLKEATLLGITDLRESILEPPSQTAHTQESGSWLPL